jgi:hypothetical protein
MTLTATRKRSELASLSREEDSQDVASYTKLLDFYVSDKCYAYRTPRIGFSFLTEHVALFCRSSRQTGDRYVQ